MPQVFRRKPIAALTAHEDTEQSLRRVLGAGDLIMLAIGAVLGAGIFGAIGTAAAGQTDTNIGTLFAFAIVSIGVVVLRVAEPDRPRPFRVPLVWVVGPLGAAACGFIMIGLPVQAWERFGLWLALGLVVYAAYGYRHSRVR